MEQEVLNPAVIRRFMLGKASEEERSAVEQRLMVDKAFYEELSVVEDELIDDFLAGELSPDELETFDSYFLASPDRRVKLNFGRALRKYISKEAGRLQPVVEGPIRPPAPDETPIQPVTPVAESDLAPAPNAAAEGDSPTAAGVTDELARDSPSQQVIQMLRPPATKSSVVARALANQYLRAAAILVIVCGAAFGIWRAFFFQSEVDKGLAATRDLYKDHRPFEAQITALAYAPYAPTRVTRGGEQQSGVNAEEQHRAELILRDAATEHPGPKYDHALGEFYLTAGKFKDAIDNLRKAVDSDANNAQYHSDLGAAWLESAKSLKSKAGSTSSGEESGKSSEKEFAAALEEINRALEINPSLLEAIFNRALVYQGLMQRDQARQDWQRYLEKDPASGWATEARQNLDKLDKLGHGQGRIDVMLLPDAWNC
jgi:tetratricopeptide (TPR) repeat protein